MVAINYSGCAAERLRPPTYTRAGGGGGGGRGGCGGGEGGGGEGEGGRWRWGKRRRQQRLPDTLAADTRWGSGGARTSDPGGRSRTRQVLTGRPYLRLELLQANPAAPEPQRDHLDHPTFLAPQTGSMTDSCSRDWKMCSSNRTLKTKSRTTAPYYYFGVTWMKSTLNRSGVRGQERVGPAETIQPLLQLS